MDSDINLSLERAQNEILLAQSVKLLTEDAKIKREVFKLDEKVTFYSAVIAHAYYAIFYAARAYVVSKGVNLPEQGVHSAVYSAFRKFVRQGKIAAELLELYEEVKVKAETLLEIFEEEKENRTKFTYKTLAQANKRPAEDSLENARIFFTQIKELIGR